MRFTVDNPSGIDKKYFSKDEVKELIKKYIKENKKPNWYLGLIDLSINYKNYYPHTNEVYYMARVMLHKKCCSKFIEGYIFLDGNGKLTVQKEIDDKWKKTKEEREEQERIMKIVNKYEV